MIKAYAQVKIAAAQANIKLGKLEKKLGNLIIKASKEVLS
jgi:fumarate hydratase class II